MAWSQLGTFQLARNWRISQPTTDNTFKLTSIPENTPFRWAGLIGLSQVNSQYDDLVVADIHRIYRRDDTEIISLSPPPEWTEWRLAFRLLYPVSISPPWLLTVSSTYVEPCGAASAQILAAIAALQAELNPFEGGLFGSLPPGI